MDAGVAEATLRRQQNELDGGFGLIHEMDAHPGYVEARSSIHKDTLTKVEVERLRLKFGEQRVLAVYDGCRGN